MTTIPSVSAAGAQIYSLQAYARAKKAQQTPAPQAPVQQPIPPVAKVNHAMTRATYDAGIDTLRNANKMMMGYLLNIEV